ncbi:MAG: aspartate dehydrogenase [Lachnospiraceae bacterium]|nr:aspartate dehydrogenase [Lachnospiraceae bacterium]
MKDKKKIQSKSYDATIKQPIIRASICNGEQVAGFKDVRTGEFEEIMLIRNVDDLDKFRKMYGITEEIKKMY